MKTHKVFYTCKRCQHENAVEVEPYIPAQICGPPESCYPAEGGAIEPEQCEKCYEPIDTIVCQDKLPRHEPERRWRRLVLN